MKRSIEKNEIITLELVHNNVRIGGDAKTDICITLESRGRSYELTLGELFEILVNILGE